MAIPAHTARLIFLALVAVVPVSLFGGRTLEQSFPGIVAQFPILALTLALFALLLLVRDAAPRSAARRTNVAINVQPLVGMCVLAAFVVLRLVDFPVEYIHLGKYSAIAFFGFHAPAAGSANRRALLGFLAAAVLGTLEETAQLFVPRRIFDLKDLLLNVGAALTGTLAALAVAPAERHK